MHETTPATPAGQGGAPPATLPVHRARRLRIALIATGLAVAAAALAGVALPRAEAHFAANGPPGASALAAPLVFRGRVIERLDAGRYGYLRIAGEDGEERWIVSMRPSATAGDTVAARAVARARDFESRRLGRTFDDLYFGPVEPAPR